MNPLSGKIKDMKLAPMRETWKHQKIDPNYKYDMPVPSEGMPTHQRNTVAASIGELGPEDPRL